MLFTRDVLEGIASGRVTLAFRRWRRSPPRPGATITTSAGVLQFERIDIVSEGDITEEDASRSGFGSVAQLRTSLAPSGTLMRIAFRRVGEDPRIGLRTQRLLETDEPGTDHGPDGQHQPLVLVLEQLRRLDRRADAPWTTHVLASIGGSEGVPARVLAARDGIELLRFKQRVRRLKALGLTESLEVGYRLSPRGRDALLHLQSSTRGA